MLNSLVIKNFRMLEDFTVEKLGRVNLIVGKNNSGKSTVLEALVVYAWNADTKILKRIAERRDEVFQQNNNRFFYEDLFTDRKFPESKYATEDELENAHFPDTTDEEIIITGTNSKSKSVHIWSTGNVSYNARGSYDEDCLIMPSQVRDDWEENFESQKIPFGFVTTQFVETEKLEKEWNEINLTDNEEIVIRALQIIVPDFKRLAFDGDNNKRWVKVKLADLPKPVPLKSLGDGMLRILQIAIKLVSAQGGFLLIDEFENGLHYSVQENVWRLLFEMAEKLDIQVFATTHSWDCIESFTKVALENETTEGVLFRMGKSAVNRTIGEREIKEGQVIATIFDKDKLSRMTESDIEVR